MIKLAELYSPHVLITRPPASFLKVTGDQKLRYDLEWPFEGIACLCDYYNSDAAN